MFFAKSNLIQRISFIIYTIVLLSSVPVLASSQSQADKFYQQGLEAHKHGQLFQALDAYTKALQLNPQLTNAYFNRGLIYVEKPDYDAAIRDFTKAIELNDKDADFYNERGICYNEKKESDKAIEDFTKAISLNSNNADYYNGLANAYSHLSNYEQAIEAYNKSIAIDSTQSYVYYNRGLAYYHTEQYDAAIQDCDLALKFIPAKERDSNYYRWLAQDSYFNKALACDKAGRSAEAITSYRHFLKYAPPALSDRIDYAKGRIKELSN